MSRFVASRLAPMLSEFALLAVLAAPAPPGAVEGPVRPPSSLHPSSVRPAAPRTTSRIAEARDLELIPRQDGSFFYKGAKGERFDAVIRADGTVEFHLEAGVQVKLDGVCAYAICLKREMLENKKQRRRKAARATVAKTATAIALGAVEALATGATSYAPTGSRGWAPNPVTAVGIPGSGVLANGASVPNHVPGATVYGRYGYLPTPHSDMIAFLRRTFDLRLRMVEEADTNNLEAALDRLPQELRDGWAARATVTERHAFVLERWEALVTPPPHLDREVAAALVTKLEARRARAAARAQAIILEFVRARAPRGSASAFTDEELRRYNAGRPAERRFEPYAGDVSSGSSSGK